MSLGKSVKDLITLVLIGALMYLLWQFSSVVIYVLISAVMAIVAKPLVRFMERFSIGGRHLPRLVTSSVALVVLWLILGGLASAFIPLIYSKFKDLSMLTETDWQTSLASLTQYITSFEHSVETKFGIDDIDIIGSLQSVIFGGVDFNVVDTLSSFASVFVTLAVSLFSITFITFYFIKEDDLFYRIVSGVFPDKYKKNIYKALDSATYLVTRYFRGVIIESFIVATIITIVMLLFGMPFSDAVVIGLVMGIMNVIPYAGPVIGSIISLGMGVLSPIDGDVLHTLIVVISTIVVVKVIDDFIIQPQLYSKQVQAHPLEVFLVILLASQIAGIWGMFLAIPLYTIIRVFAREFFSEYSVVRQLTGRMSSKD